MGNMSSRQTNQQPAQDLDWMAFCYVTDEMNSEELAEFETRLLEDQAAREAVEKAMQINSIIAGAYQSEPLSARNSVHILPETRQVFESLSRPREMPAANRKQAKQTGKRLFVTFLVVATVVLINLMLTGQLDRLFKGNENEKGRELVLAEEINMLDQSLLGHEEYAERLVDGLAVNDDEFRSDEWNDPIGVLDSVTIQGDWMLELFSELEEELESWKSDEEDSTSKTSHSDCNWVSS